MNGLFKILFFVLVVFCLLSFTLHSVELEHDHPEIIFGHDVSGHMLGEDNKFFLLLVFIVLGLFSIYTTFGIKNFLPHIQLKNATKEFHRRNNFLELIIRLFRTGILNPRIW